MIKKYLKQIFKFSISVIVAMSAIGAHCTDFSKQFEHQKRDVDEGFRWRSNLNLTIYGKNIASKNRKFNRLVEYDPEKKIFNNDNDYDDYIYKQKKDRHTDILHFIDENSIHKHLNIITQEIKNRCNASNVAVAAITLITEKQDKELEAFSRPIKINNKFSVAINSNSIKAFEDEPALKLFSLYYSSEDVTKSSEPLYFPKKIKGECLKFESNIEEPKGFVSFHAKGNQYTCAEGQIIAKLFGSKNLIKANVEDILKECNISKNNIKLVVLHIHTYMDPCARCTRLLAGVSRKFLCNQDLQLEHFGSTSELFIEVSGNENYGHSVNSGKDSISHQQMIAILDKNWHTFHEKKCAEGTEKWPEQLIAIGVHKAICKTCLGNNPIDIPLNISSKVNKLGIPFGDGYISHGNWSFTANFPPYIVFARINKEGEIIVPFSEKNDKVGLINFIKNLYENEKNSNRVKIIQQKTQELFLNAPVVDVR